MRNLKFFASFFAIFAFSLAVSWARPVSFGLLQHDFSSTEVRSSTYIMENSLLDYFFDRGYVVTNEPAFVSSGEADDQKFLKTSLEDLREGGAEYFFLLSLNYDTQNSANPEGDLLSNLSSVDWKLYKVLDGLLVDSGEKTTGRVPYEINNANGIADFSYELAIQMVRAMKNESSRKD